MKARAYKRKNKYSGIRMAKFEKDGEKNYDFTCQVDMFYG